MHRWHPPVAGWLGAPNNRERRHGRCAVVAVLAGVQLVQAASSSSCATLHVLQRRLQVTIDEALMRGVSPRPPKQNTSFRTGKPSTPCPPLPSRYADQQQWWLLGSGR